MTDRMPLPRVRNANSDAFERQLKEALPDASAEMIELAVVKACEFLERPGLDPREDYTFINNATSLICQAVRQLRKRVAAVETEGE